MHAMPFERTAVTAGDHIDWITVSPEAIRLTDSLKSFQKARNWPAFLASVRIVHGHVDLGLVMLPLSAYLMLAHGLDHHRGIHDADRGDVESRGLALELGVEQLRPVR